MAFASMNYFIYHQKIIYAEELFLKDSIQASLTAYKNIFTEYKPFAKDAFIALELACMIKDTSNANYFFNQCCKAGINWEVFNRVVYVKQFINETEYRKQAFTRTYNLERKYYYKRLNNNLRKYLISLSKKDDTIKKDMFLSKKAYLGKIESLSNHERALYDKSIEQHSLLQKYRKAKHDSSSAYYETLKRNLKKTYIPYQKADTVYVDLLEKNILILDSISKMLGYVPGDKTIGIVDHDIDDYSSIRLSFTFTPIIVHTIYHHGCGFWMMQEELRESVKRGELHPRYYAAMYDNSYCDIESKTYNPTRTNLSQLYKIKCTLPNKDYTYNIIAFNCPIENVEKSFINKCRSQLSIASIEHDHKKMEYAQKHHLILFFGLLGNEM